jgi:hypothetical protein
MLALFGSGFRLRKAHYQTGLKKRILDLKVEVNDMRK